MLLRTESPHARLEFQASAQSKKSRVYHIFFMYGCEPIERKIKKLARKYRSLPADLAPIIEQLSEESDTGTLLGKNC